MSGGEDHFCERRQRRGLRDARGIFCTFVCDQCERRKRATFHADIFEDADYWVDEPIDE